MRTRLNGARAETQELPRRFEGLSCVVTGGGRGIGRAIAERLAAEGARVGVMARSRDQCAHVADSIKGAALVADVTDAAACESAFDDFGPFSVLVCAAGVSPVRDRAETHDLSAWREVIDVNLTGAFITTQAAAPHLLAGGGAIVFVSSVLGVTGSPRLAAYGASKAALNQLTRTLAAEWGDRDVRVNAVCPGYVETDLTRSMLEVAHLRAAVLAETPFARFATLDEIVAPVLFLASDEASYVTGATLLVDGGIAA
jgi:NAD(P)-dependent dehydrogenase (short-subunit alcohol dehydrogenase family)